VLFLSWTLHLDYLTPRPLDKLAWSLGQQWWTQANGLVPTARPYRMTVCMLANSSMARHGNNGNNTRNMAGTFSGAVSPAGAVALFEPWGSTGGPCDACLSSMKD
jgi:hypothetical protein